MEVVVSRFILGGRTFYFHSKWDKTHFRLNLTDGKYVWSGEGTTQNSYSPSQADSSYIENILKPKGMTIEEYLSLAREALTTQDVTKKKFSYNIQQGETTSQIRLIWNIRLAKEANFAMKGILELNRVPDSRVVIQENLDFLTGRLAHLEEENKELKKMNKMLVTQRTEAIGQFDQLIIEKQCIETDMLSKFVDLLNEKKKKIRELKEDIKNRTSKHQPSQATLEGEDTDPDEATSTQSQLQTGESQVTPLETTSLTFNNISDPTPTFDLLRDDESNAKFEPMVRKRYRGGGPNSETQRPSPPKLISTKSFGIITLNSDSPAPKLRKSQPPAGNGKTKIPHPPPTAAGTGNNKPQTPNSKKGEPISPKTPSIRSPLLSPSVGVRTGESPFKVPAMKTKGGVPVRPLKKRRINENNNTTSRKDQKKSSDEADVDTDKLISMMDF